MEEASDKKEGAEASEEGSNNDKDTEMMDADGDMSDGESSLAAKEEKTNDLDGEEFDINGSQGFDLLSRKEVELCKRLKLFPTQYLEIKKALIYESLKNGLLDKEGASSARKTIVKVDVQKRGNILDFMVRAGWISNSLAKVARTVTPPVSQLE